MEEYKKILSKHIPEGTVDIIYDWILKYNFNLTITNHRKTKLGDFRAIQDKNQRHRISVNGNLNKYSFLITLVHEIAHLVIWEKYKRKAKPHGAEWKAQFIVLMETFLFSGVFPPDIYSALNKHMKNPPASSISDIGLYKVLNNYNLNNSKVVYVEDIDENQNFALFDGRQFKKIEKLRKRYKCISLNNSRVYYLHPMLEVIPLNL